MNYSVHESSFVDPTARIGPGTNIWHFCHIMAGAHIGAGCTLGQNVFVGRNVKIGDNVKIQNSVSVYEGVTLEDDVFCGPSVVFTNVVAPRSAHPQDPGQYVTTLVRRGATLGANATVVCGVTLGMHAFVGAGAVVTRDVPDYALVLGNPARLRGWMCQCGAKLSFSGKETTCSTCGKGYTKVSPQRIVHRA